MLSGPSTARDTADAHDSATATARETPAARDRPTDPASPRGDDATLPASPTTMPAHSRRANIWMFEPGEILGGRYRIIRFLARGGMGEVYEADDLEVSQRVAIKAMLPISGADPERREARLKRELMFARKVTHPNVCRVFDVHHATVGSVTIPFVTMELLEGETLAEHLGRVKSLAPADALPIVEQIVAGLAAAHASGVVHRDFKPGNVILIPGDTPATPRALITDFGLARAIDSERMGESTTDFAGTPVYMAPEQLLDRPVTSATDIYALGIVLYEVVTGERPFLGDQPVTTAMKRLHQDAPSARSRVPDLDPRWDAVIQRCLQREPAHRFANVAEVAAALRGEIAVPRPHRSRRALWLALALGGAAFAITAAIATVRRSSDAASPTSPRAEPSTFTTLRDGPVRAVVAVSGLGNSMVHAVTADDAGTMYFGGYITSSVTIGRTAITAPSGARTGYVAAVGPTGEVRWHRALRGSNDVSVVAVERDGRGALVVAGTRRAGVEFGDGHGLPRPVEVDGTDCWIASLAERDGAVRWTRSCDARGIAKLRALTTDRDGNVYACGEYSGTVTFGGSERYTTTPKGFGLFVVSYDPAGALRWVRAAAQAGAGGATHFGALAIRGDTLWFGGRIDGAMTLDGHDVASRAGPDALVGVLATATGAVRWLRTIEGPGTEVVHAIAPTGDAVAIAGAFDRAIEVVPHDAHTAGGDGDLFVALVDPDTGVARRAWYGTSTKIDTAIDLHAGPYGLVVVGRFVGDFDLGGHALKSTGGTDGFVARIDLAPATRADGSSGPRADRDGAIAVSLVVAGEGDDHPRAAWVGADGKVLLAGRFRLGMNLGRHVIQARGITDGFVLELREPVR